MHGWKTYLAATGAIVYGIGGFIAGMHDVDTMVKLILSGVGLAGIGHKIDKISSEVK